MKVFNFLLNFFSKENSIYMFIYNKCMLHSEVRCYAFNVSISLTTLIRSVVLSFANCPLKLDRSCQCILFLFYRLLRRDKVRPPTEPHYNNSTQLRKKEHHKHVKMFLLGRNESVGMYPPDTSTSIPLCICLATITLFLFHMVFHCCVYKAIWL